MEADALVSEYMGRLEAAAQPLPADRRGELIAEVHDHIETALAEAGSRDEVTARNVLERLGAPEEIVAVETGGEARPPGLASPAAAVVEGGPRVGDVRSWPPSLPHGRRHLPARGRPADRDRAWCGVHRGGRRARSGSLP